MSIESDGANHVRELVIGSKRGSHLRFKRPTVSGRHARLFFDEAQDAWFIEDLGSTNGTYLHGKRLTAREPNKVEIGDAVHLGKSFHFVVSRELLSGNSERVQSADVLDATLQEELKSQDKSPKRATDPVMGLGAIPSSPFRKESGVEEQSPKSEVEFVSPRLDEVARARLEASLQTLSQSEENLELIGQDGPQLTQEIPVELLERAATAELAKDDHEKTLNIPVEELPPDAVSISIGYADDNTVQIKNPVVSGHHARLYRVGQAYVLEDQGSTNGTWFRGERIERVWVSEQDRFSVGNYGLTVSNLVKYFPAQTRIQRTLMASALASTSSRLKIGRSPECDIRLDAPMVSGFHASLMPLSDGRFRLEDLGSTNGTFVNSRENQVTTATVGPEDVIFLGSYRLPLSRLDSLVSRIEAEQQLAIPPDKEVILIGRDESCDIVLSGAQVSRHQAELRRLPDGRFELRDLSSINGTFVNGERIKSSIIQPSDLLSFANYRMRLDTSAGVVRRDYHGDIMLQAERITYEVRSNGNKQPYKTIIQDASFTVYPTEFVGLMGPSGAGKTTLMLALNGYTMPTTGRSLINGYDLYSNYASFRGNIGYVPQDDIIYRELTVYESLYYTSKLRLPPDTSDQEISRKIDEILRTLEIGHTREVVVGDALKKGISGGERKRVNLAQELITEPSLLFLDEPTSGLASEDAINVMNLLRRLADEGRTIIMTIHQPSLESYRKLDNVIYMYNGRVVYYGPAYPDGITFFNPEIPLETPEGHLLLSDPGSALKALADEQRQIVESQPCELAVKEIATRRAEEFVNSRYYKDYVYDRAVARRDRVRLAEGNKQKTERRGWLRQWQILTRRCLAIKRKDVVNTVILLLQAPIIGGVLWLVFTGRMSSYFDQVARGPAALFLLVMSAVWFGCSNSAREIVNEQAIYKRERMVNLMIPSYVLSKFAVLGLLCTAQCAMLLLIVYPSLGYSGSFGLLYLLLFLVSLSGVGMGLTLSAVVRSSEAAMALVPLLLIPQIMLGGILLPNHDLNTPMRLFSLAMTARWGFEGSLHIEYGDDHLETIRDRCGIDLCPDPTDSRRQNGPEDGAIRRGAFGEFDEGQSYLPRGEGEDQDICNILCTNARRGAEVTPLERSFGLVLGTRDPMRHRYFMESDVGVEGTQSSLRFCFVVLVFMNCLLFGLVCSILRIKDVEVG